MVCCRDARHRLWSRGRMMRRVHRPASPRARPQGRAAPWATRWFAPEGRGGCGMPGDRGTNRPWWWREERDAWRTSRLFLPRPARGVRRDFSTSPRRSVIVRRWSRHHPLELLDHVRNVHRRDPPDLLVDDRSVIMREDVTLLDDGGPRNLGMRVSKVLGDVARRLADTPRRTFHERTGRLLVRARACPRAGRRFVRQAA